MITAASTRPILPAANDRLLRVNEAADLLGCSIRLVQKLASTGDLPRIKLGRAARFRLTDVRLIIERGVVGR